jgi:inosine/xanthosine triphosphatase
MKKIIVGSRNPVKITCTRTSFERCFPYVNFNVEGVHAPSGVADQPMSDEETYQGALNRAKAIKEKYPEAEFWVGIEGGLEVKNNTMEAFAWVVILGRHLHIQGQSRTSTFFLPGPIVDLIRKGHELGEATDIIFNKDGTKQKGGAVGMLTRDLLGRAEYYEQAVLLALVPFMNPHLYANGL